MERVKSSSITALDRSRPPHSCSQAQKSSGVSTTRACLRVHDFFFSGCPVEMKISLVLLIFSTVDIGISGSVKVTVRVSLLCLLSKVKG